MRIRYDHLSLVSPNISRGVYVPDGKGEFSSNTEKSATENTVRQSLHKQITLQRLNKSQGQHE